jgi:hypothetical protein
MEDNQVLVYLEQPSSEFWWESLLGQADGSIGLVWFGLIFPFGLVWFGLVWFGKAN